MIVNYASRGINKLKASLNDDARVIIYDRHMFIVQASGVTFGSLTSTETGCDVVKESSSRAGITMSKKNWIRCYKTFLAPMSVHHSELEPQNALAYQAGDYARVPLTDLD
jgi:hypothetical protein